ncbi:hypothetical protein [Agaribacterium sp. ZY112]|uniref:hypothetical protein n=1 Tax=Agaribacterium sp. ZY112 TaxID=3233574 RepID=UPI003523BCF0
MADQRYIVKISGAIQENYSHEQVSKALAQFLKIDEDKAAQFINSKRILNKGVNETKATKYKHKLESIGLVIDLIPEGVTGSISHTETEQEANGQSNRDNPLHTSLNLKALVVAAATALIGALLWMFIAITFNLELGIVAWAIGGAIGFAVSLTGTRGQKAAIACAAFALFSIVLGKYLIIDNVKKEMELALTDPALTEQMRYAYEEEKELSLFFAEQSTNEESQYQFMVDYGYTEASDINGISQIEKEDFINYSAPRLKALANNKLSFEQWQQDLNGIFEEVSNLELLSQSFAWADILFLLLGIGTAYRLVNTKREES